MLLIADVSPTRLRRTSAKLCRSAVEDLEQIEFILGYSSILPADL
jgi:hypothetical protein